MTWSQEISQLITDVDQLTSAANIRKSAIDASVTSTETDKNAAATSVVSATASFASASTKAQEAEAHKNAALAIYGTTAAQQTAVSSVQASAILASGFAASGSAALQQDLSGIAAALHRSPNAVTSMFIYDTSKDSDGGAWTEKCQNTSWYNEPIMGKWLGQQPSELEARYAGSTLNVERVINGSFDSTSNWVAWTGTLSISSGKISLTVGDRIYQSAVVLDAAANAVVYDITTTAGVLTTVSQIFILGARAYRLQANLQCVTSGRFQFLTSTLGDGKALELKPISGSFSVDNVSVREVTALNTQSGDYFQLTTDGKFYRLWKNLLPYSNTFTNAAWLTFSGGVTLSANTTETLDPFGSNTATKLSYIATSGAVRNQVAIPVNGVTSIYIKGGKGNIFSVTTGPNFSDSTIVNPIDGSILTLGTSQTSAIMTPVGNSWYRLTITKNTTGNFLYLGYANASTAAAGDYVYICAAQVENGTTATTYEAKAAEGSTSEVFRGNKRDFPRLAGIVAEAASVTIYDLTEPGRPMWMRFSGAANMIISNTSTSTIYALVAKLVVGGSAAMQIIDFMTDSGISIQTQATFKARHNISQRNQTLGVDAVPFGAVIQNNTVNSVAMTVMPDAPTDPVTGLRVPTIAVATLGGVSIIKHDGMVVSGDGQWTDNITITPNIMTWYNRAFTVNRYLLNPGKAVSNFSVGTYSSSDFSSGVTQRDITPKRSLRLRSLNAGSVIKLLNQNDVNIVRGLQSTITNIFNTGWMPGDIRRAYLSDIITGSAATDNLADNLASYTLPGTYTGISSTPVVGKTYEIRITFSNAGGSAQVDFGGNSSGWVGVSVGVRVIRVTATATTALYVRGDGNTSGTFSNVSVREIIVDRSYKAQRADIAGTLTRTQLASGTSLVGYSGWSTSNYLQEPYSIDLDFGTGEWSASAWFNTAIGSIGNHVTYSGQLDNAAWTKDSGTTVTANVDGTADKIIPGTVSGVQGIRISALFGAGPVISCEVKAAGYTRVSIGEVAHTAAHSSFDLSTGTKLNNPNFSRIEALSDGWYRISMRPRQLGAAIGVVGAWAIRVLDSAFTAANNPNLYTWTGNGTDGILVRNVMVSNQVGDVTTTPPNTYIETVATAFLPIGQIFERSFTTGTSIKLGINASAQPVATIFDGTNTRTLTSSISYDANQWTHIRVNYTTDGSLTVLVNGREIGVTRGNPLLTLNNTSAVLTIGNSFIADAPFPGSIALLKLGTTAPTAEQSVFMFEQERQLFRANAVSVLPDSNTILDMSYDDATDRWVTVSTANESYWTGLVRNSVTPVPAGSYSRIATTSGIELAARITTNPGVDVTIPAYVLREELVKRSELATKLNRQIVVYDYIGGFTGNITTGSTAIVSVTNLTYPVSLVGARISGTGIPANATITAVSGTTIYISAAATATTSALVISFLDFNIPVGSETESVTTAGVVKQEGTTKDYTRIFDGFIETIRFAVAPGATTWVRIQATKSIQ